MTTIYIPTNRYNAVAILSSRLHVPAAAYTKYYKDLLSLTPGNIVFTTGPISTGIAEYLSSDGSAVFPVMIETTLAKGASLSKLPSVVVGGTRYVAPGAVVPLLEPKLHFRTQEELDEFAARSYANLDPAALTTTVTPDLFAADEPLLEQLSEALHRLSDQPQLPESPQLAPVLGMAPAIAAADALAGAAVMLMQAATDETTVLIAASGLAMVAALTREPDDGALAAMLDPLVGAGEAEALRAITGAILRDPSGPREAPAEFASSLSGAVPGDSRFDTALGHAVAVLRGQKPLPHFGAAGRPVMRALLLFLLQPEPCDALGWPAQNTGATPAEMALAAAFSGIARRFTGLPSTLRGLPALQSLVAAGVADRVNRTAASSPIGRYLPKTPSLTSNVRPGEPGFVSIDFKSGSRVLLQRRTPEAGRRGELLRTDLNHENARVEAIDVADRMGWTDAVRYLILIPPSLKWVSHATAKGKLIEVRGGPPIVTADLDDKRYRRRLAATAPGDLDRLLAAGLPDQEGQPGHRPQEPPPPAAEALPGI